MATETPTDAPGSLDINHAKSSRLGWVIALLGFGGFVLWAALAPLDQGVSASGQVVVSGNRKLVQNLAPGMVEAILVKDGDVVQSGDVLVRLDTTAARAQYETARAQWITAKASEARFLADTTGQKDIRFPPEFTSPANTATDQRWNAAMAVQTQLLRARRGALEADLNVLRSSMVGLESTLTGIEATRRAKEEQAQLLRTELSGLRTLAGDGYLPRNRLSEQERLLVQLQGAASEDAANLSRTRQNIVEVRMRMLARQQEYRKENEVGLSDAQKEASGLDSRIEGLAFELANTVVKAPSEGVVVGLNVHTVGGVIPAAHPLMEIVPKNEQLKVEVQIPTAMIDKVKIGLPVQIMFPAFSQRTTPQIPGQFVQVAADATTDPQGKVPPFYKGQVVVTPEGMGKLATHEIKAGMPADVFVKSGERTLLNYLFKPLSDHMRAALTEP
ncbi:type I secretion system membrane fusion protein PrsE [Comamonadaceae bacterium OS-1]|nr:type I secretion system membrane fusion protein PrsE [Comamonadaceae bacterium OS-1]